MIKSCKEARNMPFYIVIILALAALDQAVKYWAFTVLRERGTIPLIANVFHLTYVENRGAAFSLFSWLNFRWLFVVLAAIITVILFLLLYRKSIPTKLGRAALVLIASGAIGNAIDRMIRGFVVDLFDFRLIYFPVFNIADVLICTGAALFIWYVLFQYQEPEEAIKESVATESEQEKKE